MKYEITYESNVTIEAESFDDAREKFVKTHHLPDAAISFYNTETNEEKAIVGHCEISELPIFEDEEFESDSEGVMWLKRMEE